MDEIVKCVRNKTWDEMNDGERIVALQDAVVWMSRDLIAANSALVALGQHKHADDGSLLIPLHINNVRANDSGYAPDYAASLKSKRHPR